MRLLNRSEPRSKKGQSLVELALTATLLMFLLLGVIDFGFAFMYFISIRDAAQEGATYGSLHPGTGCEGTLRSWVKGASTSPLLDMSTLSNSQILISRTGTSPGDSITVKVTYNYNLISPFQFQTSIPISTSVSQTILQVDPNCP